eukprot:CAMPEP_0203971012 /NCGR_PEP_ID=MMETSP0359-20131031/98259_1 /ASSEMBLY_ACC=CAM_ASM_000338 /TAXON_ID=268821 /ORGANISM="Scrippsiella Hangoei, Strain SHTV-5" /LENGTH=41 /DNA_ID= /DNA_START= /DNA_END= /DNA_ORIENTATION=
MANVAACSLPVSDAREGAEAVVIGSGERGRSAASGVAQRKA